jgi:NTP pyrophosphatase (non-canonical NTP hydrolase)
MGEVRQLPAVVVVLCLDQLGVRIVNLNDYASQVHEANKTWWVDPQTGQRIERNKGEQQMLIVSEIAEAMEGVRKNLMDDHLPHRTMEEVEMADALIRILDYCGGHGLDIDGAFREKMAYNAKRADHKLKSRAQDGGKKF